MRTFEIKDRAEVEGVATAMKKGERFVIVTDDENFHPLGCDRHSAEVWIGAAGGGALMLFGAGAIVLAWLDPEPTSKLGLLVGGGFLMLLTGGSVIVTILVTRSGYTSRMGHNPENGRIEWTLEPR